MRSKSLRNILITTATVIACTAHRSTGAQITAAQLASILPTEAEVSTTVRTSTSAPPLKFGRVQPSGERLFRNRPLGDSVVDDDVRLGVKARRAPREQAPVSYIVRGLYSVDKRFRLIVDGECASSQDLTMVEMGRNEGGQAVPSTGTFASGNVLGDDSWFVKGDRSGNYLRVRCGNLVLAISGHFTRYGSAQVPQTDSFIPTALDAFACRMLFAASQIQAVTGVASKQWSLAVNGVGHAALIGTDVAGHIFVSPRDVCKAAGISAVWNADFSSIDVKGGAVRLLPGSGECVRQDGTSTKIKLPPFMYKDQCLMDLDDLLTVLGGSRTTNGDTISIRL